MNEVERELGWDDPIEKDGKDFILLPEGDYDFTITKFERGRFAGSEKLPACNKATVTVTIDSPEGTVNIDHALFLHTKTEGLLCAFFVAIGQRKHGERVTMNWNAVVGAKGRCKIGTRTWKDKNDPTKEYKGNEIKKFYEPTVQQTVFTPGSF